MKVWLIGLVVLCGLGSLHAQGQATAAFSLNWWQADVNWPKMWGEPVARMNKSKFLNLGKQFEAGADLSLQKNTRPNGIIGERRLVGSYEARIPLYFNYFPRNDIFIGFGGYTGVVAYIHNQPEPIIFTQRFVPDEIKIDAGVVVSVGYQFRSFGKAFIRYNFGVLKVVPSIDAHRDYNRALDVGFSVKI